MTKSLNVWWGDRQVGVLEQTKGGALRFAYRYAWATDANAPSLSQSLPKQIDAFDQRDCRPFFAGLLPEETQRRRAAAAVGVSDGNDFALLEALGEDVANAIVFLPPGEVPLALNYEPQDRSLTSAELVEVLRELPTRPLLAGDGELRLSLAGAQSKLPVVLVDGQIALPAPGQPTTHILKNPIPHFPGTTENEAFVMRLAAAVGFDVAAVEPRVIGNHSFLLVTRYDRVRLASGKTLRMHQEDFCQALGVLPQRKYASEGGPTFKKSFALLRETSSVPARDVLRLLDAALFNLIVGNADAHGKNFSLLYEQEATRLAPLYDLVATVRYPALSPNLAMRIGGASRLEEIDDESWERFSSDIKIPVPAIRRRGADLCKRMASALVGTRDALLTGEVDGAQVRDVVGMIDDRIGLAALRLPKVKAPRNAKREAIDLALRPRETSDGAAVVVDVDILNRSGGLITGGHLIAEIIGASSEDIERLRIANDITLPTGMTRAIPLATFGTGGALLQYQRVAGFFSKAGRGLLHAGRDFDLIFASDQKMRAKLRCRLQQDDRGRLEIVLR